MLRSLETASSRRPIEKLSNALTTKLTAWCRTKSSRSIPCAVAIQKALAAYNAEHPETPLYLRIGLSAGEPIEEHGDLFGKAVQLAARLCAHAEPARILVDQVVLDQWSGKHAPFSDLGEVTPKGFDHAVRVYEVQWTRT